MNEFTQGEFTKEEVVNLVNRMTIEEQQSQKEEGDSINDELNEQPINVPEKMQILGG